MKHFSFFCVCLFLVIVSHAQWKPLHLDINFVGIGLQSTYKFNNKLHVQAAGGIGWSTVAEYNLAYYQKHNAHDHLSGDLFGLGHHFIAPYVLLGFKYHLLQKQVSGHNIYLRYYFKTNIGSSIVALRHDDVQTNFRNTILIGFGNFMDRQRKWAVAFELGAALWHNYDFCHKAIGPKMNLQITYDLIN